MPLSALQQKLASQLLGGQFRYLNERLYSQSGEASLGMMRADPSLFAAYHAGFRSQVSAWPRNPLDVIIGELRRAPRGQVVADFGCGEARLAAALAGGASPHCARVHSFDLVAPPPGAPGAAAVTACNMARVPLPAETVHTSVFCLSLMGTDYMAFLAEGVRVLQPGGRLLVAEIRSRFEGGAGEGSGSSSSSSGGGGGGGGGGGADKGGRKRPRESEAREEGGAGAGGLPTFIAAVAALGCRLEKKEESNKMFVFLTFVKEGSAAGSSGGGGAGAAAAVAGGSGGGEGSGKKSKKGGGKWPDKGNAQQQQQQKQRHQQHQQQQQQHGAAPGPALKPCVYKKR